MAEAYNIIDVIGKSQLAFFSQHQEFKSISSPNPQYLSQPMMIEADPEWETFGYHGSVGSNVYFSYRTWAGKIDESGTELGVSLSTGNNLTALAEDGPSRGHYSAFGLTCNAGLVSASTLGAPSTPDFNWTIIYAVGDLNNDQGSLCTAVAKHISATGSEKDPSSSGFIIMNAGQ